jgi:hypothetical protein
MILYVSFFNETHNGSICPVAYLKGARLELSMDAGGEEKYPDSVLSIRGKQLQRRHHYI